MRPEAHKGALVATGVIAIVVGGLSAFVTVIGGMMMAISSRNAVGAHEPQALGAAVAGATFYGMGALSLIWLGIGTLRARRWGRALMLISSWMWLVIDGFVACAVITGIVKETPSHIGLGESMVLFPAIGVALVVFVGMPLAFVLVLGRPGMKETVEALDPTPRWTDRRPLTILGTCLVLLWMSLFCGLLAFDEPTLWHLSGSSATMGYALLSLLMLVCAVGLWRGLAIALVITAIVFLGLVASLSVDMWRSDGFWPFLVAVPMYVAGAAFLWRLRRHVV